MRCVQSVRLGFWLVLSAGALWQRAGAQAPPLQISQPSMLVDTNFALGINWQSYGGVPISNVATNGSDGRYNFTNGPSTLPATPHQFQSWIGFAAIPVQTTTNLNGTLGFFGNVTALNWPRSTKDGSPNGQVTLVLRSAQVGASYLGQSVSFYFGAVIPPPSTDEQQEPLPAGVGPFDYWFAMPFSTNNFTNAPYYWSPNAQAVFATQPGRISIVWKKSSPTNAPPPDYPTNSSNYSVEAGFYYRLFTVNYLVSGSAVKTPEKMYWTEGTFQSLGHPVDVPPARVSAVNVVYNNAFPGRVAQPYVDPNQVTPVNPTNMFQETRTLWFDSTRGQILAYNTEGRVFVELLGELNPDGVTRHFLGFEIVDVFKQAAPSDVVINLGERLTAYQNGADDSALYPTPIQVAGQQFYYRQNLQGSSRPILYANRETINLNDFQVHWLITGVAGLQWPFIFDRYHQVWPADPAMYSFYLRPLAATDAEAQLTAVQLPSSEAPSIDYQDPLDVPRAKLTQTFAFYTWLNQTYPAHRTLLRFNAGDQVAFERVFSWLDIALKTNSLFVGSVATNLSGWNPTNSNFSFARASTAPYLINSTVIVGARILAPPGELGSTGAYWAGYIRQTNGNSFHPDAYLDPFAVGFTQANQGAIIPVNAIPGKNLLEVWWFRPDNADLARGFQTIFWPTVIGRYTLQWPADAREIILASNAGSGPLASLQAKGSIYYQNDPTLPGYNPNEEHALMLAGQAYALRDDLNVTNLIGYTSDPFVLISYTDADSRPSMSVFRIRREKPEAGILFDYIVDAGTLVQAPMPLPLLPPPVAGSGPSAINYNREPPGTSGDLPIGWNSGFSTGPFSHYPGFTYQDRKNEFWVYRGLHAGPPPLLSGQYNPANNSFGPLPAATGILNQPFSYYVHVSRRIASLTMNSSGLLPAGLSVQTSSNGLAIVGVPAAAGSNFVTLTILDTADNSRVTNTLSINVLSNGVVVAQGPLAITSTNQYSAAMVTYTNRPPQLAQAPTPTNSFTMQFYYETLPGFAWPGVANPPPVGSIVPYLLPRNDSGFIGDPTSSNTPSLNIVYRPTWPALINGQPVPTLFSGQTLTAAKNGLAAVRGQSSVNVLYQQSIGLDIVDAPPSVVLFDPTVQKASYLGAQGLLGLPPSVLAQSYQGKMYFPNLPPNLVNRVFFDPNATNLVLQGQFVDDLVGEKYVFLNVLRGADLAAVKGLCPITDAAHKTQWDQSVDALAVPLYTFHEDPAVPGSYVADPSKTLTDYVGDLVQVTSSDQQVDSYALSASGPGLGYITYITGNGLNPNHAGEPVSVYVARVAPPLYTGELKIVESPNPLSEMITFQHTSDLAGRSSDYQYDWRIMPPVDGQPPAAAPDTWIVLTNGVDITHFTLGGAGVQSLSDNYVIVRYRNLNALANPATTNWSAWTAPALAEGWIKRVLGGINPFNQRTTDLFNNPVNTTGSIISQAGHRWEGDVALNQDTINNFGLIEIYETVLHRGQALSINSGINYGPANDALLLAAGYLNDLYMFIGNDAWADAANPTIGIGTADKTYGNIATALFAFKGQVASLLEEEMALLRGRDDFLAPGVNLAPVYNRLFWNYTRGIDAGEVIYALNYNILDQNNDGSVGADDAAILFPQGHGDAYGHYLTALGNYYSLLMNPNFDWVPRIEAVTVLGATVSVDYQDERKFAAAAAALARTGRQVFDLTWRQNYQPGTSAGWGYFGTARSNPQRSYNNAGATNFVTRYWGMDHWATRVGQGSYLNWVVGNAILPPVDPDPTHEGIQKVDRTTVPELQELPQTAAQLQTDMDNAEGGFTPVGLSQNSVPFDINPLQVTGSTPLTHFEQIYQRAVDALNNAVVAFNDAQNVTQLMRSEEDSLDNFQAGVNAQELAYNNQLVELYGSPYPDDIGPGKTYPQGYTGPDLIHFTYVENPDANDYNGALPDPTSAQTFKVDIQQLPPDWVTNLYTDFSFNVPGFASNYSPPDYLAFNIGPNGFFDKPTNWTTQRASPGKIQQAISDLIGAKNKVRQELANAVGDKQNLDKAIQVFFAQKQISEEILNYQNQNLLTQLDINKVQADYANLSKGFQYGEATVDQIFQTAVASVPNNFIFGLAAGGDLLGPARLALGAIYLIARQPFMISDLVESILTQNHVINDQQMLTDAGQQINQLQLDQNLANQVVNLGTQLGIVQNHLSTINSLLRKLDDATRAYNAAVAEGNRIQQERLTFRQHAAAVVQGFRTRDAAFRIFQNEKLERYKTLFDLAAEYSFLAANAYDYETGLLNSDQGKAFLNRILSARALGVINNGVPQYAGSDTGDPGLSSALAEMKADWDVLKGRLGFNNPDGYGTVASLRTENFRILPGTNGDSNWQDVLLQGQMANILDDSDVKRYCLQVDDGSGLPVPGIVLTFGTVIGNGLNIFGQPLAPGDHAYSPSSFATKVFAVGVDFDGYIGMDNPTGTVGSTTDPNALAANPYVYLIPVGADSMRAPPLGDTATVRTWNVDDLTIPLPFNISASDFSAAPFYTSSDSLSEPLFSVRKHQAFRPVSTTAAFTTSIYGATGSLQPSEYTNRRLIGRSVWNSKWKLVIPGRSLLADPNQGLDRFVQSVKDVKLYFVTYSYSGN